MPFQKSACQLKKSDIDFDEFCEALVKTSFYKKHEPEKTELSKFEPVTKVLFVIIKNLTLDKKLC